MRFIEMALDLQTLPGIGPALAEQMERDGIDSREKVLALGVEGLAQYRGINQVKAEMILNAVATMKVEPEQPEKPTPGHIVDMMQAAGMDAEDMLQVVSAILGDNGNG